VVTKIDLHDATLVSIEVDWATKTTIATFRMHPSRIVHLVASDARCVLVPHDEPWGPSASVNEVRQIGKATGGGEIEIEMQSGDVIRINAEGFAWK